MEEEIKRKRGRPPKPKPPIDPNAPPKKRGRPPKPKVNTPPKKRGRPPKKKPETNTLREANGRYLPKNYIATDEQIAEYNASRVGNQMYSKDADSGEKVAAVVKYVARELENLPQRINFSDTELVRDTVLRYIHSCENYGVIPTKIGLARACGCDRETYARWMQRNPNHPTSRLLAAVGDSFSEALSQASLNGSVQPIVGIFLQKALYGLRENEPMQQAAETPLTEATDTDTLIRKYNEITTE